MPNAAAAEEAIVGQEGTLLRFLILHRGRPLTKEEIAVHLTRSASVPYRPVPCQVISGACAKGTGPDTQQSRLFREYRFGRS